MACSEDVAGTLRAQEHGHQPLIVDKRSDEMMPALYENHGIDARYYEILTKQFIHRFNSTEKELLDELNMERSVFYDRKREALFLFSVCLFGYAVPELQGELDMPRLYPD